jgi:uncharacterized membrane protein
MAIDPASFNLTELLKPAVESAVATAVGSSTANFDARLQNVETAVATAAAQAVPVLVQGATSAVVAVEGTITHDQLTQRYVIWGLTAGIAVGAIIVLVFYLLGNGPAGHIVGGVPIAAVGLGLWHSNTNIPLPKRPSVAVLP